MKLLITTPVFVIAAVIVFAQGDDARVKNYNIKKGIAIEGFDPVSYFSNKPLEGKTDFMVAYHGITYRFANAANLSKFKSSPDQFEPAYGGWCAYAMGATGERVKIDPETFKILNGKLFLFYNFWGKNTLTDWNKNERELKAKGDLNWKKFIP